MKKLGIGLLGAVAGAIAGAVGISIYNGKLNAEGIKKVEKFKGYYKVLNQWMINKSEGKKSEQYFIQHGYRTIAIYGMGELGNRLYDELKDTEVEVKYAIDKSAVSTYAELDVVDLDEDLDEVDVIVVTAMFDFDEVSKKLEEKVGCPIISLEDAIFEF